MIRELLCWITSREVLDSVLQLGLLVATIGLILVGISQFGAAKAQAKAAYAQVEGTRRPFFQIRRGEKRAGDRWQALLYNEGPGIAFQTTWKLLGSYANLVAYDDLGAVGVASSIPMPFSALDTRKTLEVEDITAEGVCVEYQDAVGKRYWSVVTRAPEGFLITKTGPGDPPVKA
jgi:hypothetical protein